MAGTRRAARSLAAVAATLSIAAAATGCGIFGDDAAAPDTEPATTTEATTTTVVPAGEPTLLDPGAEPRTELRLDLAPGTETTLAVTTDLAITQTGGDGRRQRLDSPPVTQWITYVVTDVGPDGAEVDLEVVAAFAEAAGTGLAPEAVAALDDALAGIVGTTGGATITDRGRVEGATFDVPDGAPGAVVDQLDAVEAQVAALGPPLPTEAVGVGARWEATATTPLQGASIRTTTTYTLTSLDGGAVAYEAEIRLEADAQDLAIAGLDEGTTARLASTSGSGTATGVQQLGDLGLELTARTETDQEVELTDADGTASLAQEITTATSVRTPDP